MEEGRKRKEENSIKKLPKVTFWLDCSRLNPNQRWRRFSEPVPKMKNQSLTEVHTTRKTFASNYPKLLLVLIFLSFSTLSFAQEWKLVRSFPVPKLHKMQADRYGNLFVADKRGNIFKLDSLGRTLETYSPKSVALPSDLQVSQSVNVFVFYEDWQRFVLLDRFLGNARTFEFSDSEEIGYVKSACWASDGNVWLFDQSNFSLKKYNPTTKSILLSLPFNFSLENEELEITQVERA